MISDDLLAEIPVLGFDLESAERYGKVRADLLTAGITVNPVDLMIAATALEHGLTMVTNNVRHFEVIPGLNLEDWLSK